MPHHSLTTAGGSGIPGGGARSAGTVAMPAGRPAALLTLALCLAACRGPREEVLEARRCSRQRPCLKPNLCLGEGAGQREGVCVRPCQGDKECPADLRCTGRYLLAGSSGLFCQRPSVAEGGDCRGLLHGCQAGLRCFRNRCHRLCATDRECPDPRRRCLQVVDSPVPGAPSQVQFNVCLEALRQQGETCDPAGPFCARSHVCHEGRCLKVCTGDSGCAPGQVCDGSLYMGENAKTRAERGDPADLLYCRAAGGDGDDCNLRKDKSCARGLFCLGARCRKIQHAPLGAPCQEIRGIFCTQGALCHHGRCRALCKTSADCKPVSGPTPRCETFRSAGKNQGVCL